SRLELQANAELEFSFAGLTHAGDFAEVAVGVRTANRRTTRRAARRVGIVELGRVEEVERIRVELSGNALGEVEVLEQRQIHQLGARANEVVAAGVARVEVAGDGKCRGVDEELPSARGIEAADGRRITNDVETAVVAVGEVE